MKIIARIHNDFPEKFGIPRQSGLVDSIAATVVFEPEFRNPAALKGLEGYSHIWLLWQFSENLRDGWVPCVHPPRLGGNKHMGVFATRSPFRPNPIGLSSVLLERIEILPQFGPVLHVRGVDLMDGTPIYDIKPYLPYTDSHPEASCGFAGAFVDYRLKVVFPAKLLALLPEHSRDGAVGVLAQDPRPSYQHDPNRIYGIAYAGKNIRFRVADGVLTVCEVGDFLSKPHTAEEK
ncbi:MAG: tRNA (N6-threonylcarbamoyladenosine(37)-N6)-methyltransferase TrmO [Lachnospiraceae bacterium]|nr:tRNA (N6-threonylcarbamoyladenosine(37)-N6)-methyltransferase TrmO [Lachnospiraceae bacterium]